MFGCYRTGDANDPETFVAAITAVLSRYPEQVITSVTHPASGIVSEIKWLPSVMEVKEACERAVLPIKTYEARQRRIAEQLEARRLEDEARARKPTLEELKAKYGPNWGIDPPRRAEADPEADRRALQRTERRMLAEYAAMGIEPKYSGDMLISPSLYKQIVGTRELENHIDNGFSLGSI